MNNKTWKVVDKGEGFLPCQTIELTCPNCGTEAVMPYREWLGNPVIAACGLALIFDRPGMGEPPYQMMPKAIQCRTCKVTFAEKEGKEEVV